MDESELQGLLPFPALIEFVLQKSCHIQWSCVMRIPCKSCTLNPLGPWHGKKVHHFPNNNNNNNGVPQKPFHQRYTNSRVIPTLYQCLLSVHHWSLVDWFTARAELVDWHTTIGNSTSYGIPATNNYGKLKAIVLIKYHS